MKRLLCCLLIAMLAFSSIAVGCEKEEGSDEQNPVSGETETGSDETIFFDLTGIPNHQTVLRIGDSEVEAEVYFFLLCSTCMGIEDVIVGTYNETGEYAELIDQDAQMLDWTKDLDGVPLMEFAKRMVLDDLKIRAGLQMLAEENGIGVTEEDQMELDSAFDRSALALGGPDVFEQYIKIQGLSRENFDAMSHPQYLYNHLVEAAQSEDSPFYLTPEEMDAYVRYADHILLATVDPATGKNLEPTVIVEKYGLAENILEQLNAAEDPVAKFSELAEQYGEDPGRAQNPSGYVYVPGTMVQEFEDAVDSLAAGEISGIVQSEYGFHIILRRDTAEVLEMDSGIIETVLQAYVDDRIAARGDAAEITYDPCLNDVDCVDLFLKYVFEVQGRVTELLGN